MQHFTRIVWNYRVPSKDRTYDHLQVVPCNLSHNKIATQVAQKKIPRVTKLDCSNGKLAAIAHCRAREVAGCGRTWS